MSLGLDYVTGPPIDAMKAAGVTFVCRYLSEVNPQTEIKILTPGEAKALEAAGIALVSNYEWYAERPLEGEAAGVADAQIAAKQHAECGGPADRPIYFSVDIDVDGAQIAGYFKGVASVIGKARTGAYGSFRVLKYLFDNGLIAWGWQTYAWSAGVWEPRAQLQQYQNGVVLSGRSVDYDRSTKSDFGQWGGQTMIDLANPEVAAHFAAVSGGWQCKQTGKLLHGAILDFYTKYGNSAFCGLTYLGLPKSGEVPLDPVKLPHVVKQYFERGVLVYDPGHLIDAPPGSGAVYLAQLYNDGPGTDPAIPNLQKEVSALQSQLTAAKQQPGAPQLQAAALQAAEELAAAVGRKLV